MKNYKLKTVNGTVPKQSKGCEMLASGIHFDGFNGVLMCENPDDLRILFYRIFHQQLDMKYVKKVTFFKSSRVSKAVAKHREG